MKTLKAAPSRRDQLRAQLADLKMPGALEALDEIIAGSTPRCAPRASPR